MGSTRWSTFPVEVMEVRPRGSRARCGTTGGRSGGRRARGARRPAACRRFSRGSSMRPRGAVTCGAVTSSAPTTSASLTRKRPRDRRLPTAGWRAAEAAHVRRPRHASPSAARDAARPGLLVPQSPLLRCFGRPCRVTRGHLPPSEGGFGGAGAGSRPYRARAPETRRGGTARPHLCGGGARLRGGTSVRWSPAIAAQVARGTVKTVGCRMSNTLSALMRFTSGISRLQEAHC